MKKVPFRLGTTSYIIPDDILPNVRYLAGKTDDVELVLFEVDDGQNNLPSEETVAELNRTARANGMSYTVHLPLDLRLGAGGSEQHISLEKAQKVIERTRPLDPWAYVLHMDGRDVIHDTDLTTLQRWNDQGVRALEIAAGWAGAGQLLAVENLENYPLTFWDEIFRRAPVSMCLDVGHLWRDGHDPLPFLQKHIARARVMHIHGIAERDHKSLIHMPLDERVRVFDFIIQANFSGVLTLEIFGQEDFDSSMEAVHETLSQLGMEDRWRKR